MNLRKAYRKMLKDVVDMGVSHQSLLNARYRLGRGEWPKDSTMRKRLTKAGWKRKQEEEWDVL